MGYLISVLFVMVGGVLYATTAGTRAPFPRSIALWVAAVTALLWTGWNSAYQVPAGHVGIVYSFGAIVNQTSDGLQWVAPWRSITRASIQVQGHKFDKLDSFSLETQDVFVAATINIQVSPENIQELYREVGPEYFDVLVRPRVLQAFKDATVRYSSVQIAPNREAIRKEVRERLTTELMIHSIAVQDLLIDNISFSAEFQNAIEEKQRQSQLALAEREKVASEKAKADQAIETARGAGEAILITASKQAEANKKLAESLSPQLVQYIFASKLAPNVSVMLVPSSQQFILSPEMLKPQPK
ncbi:MAG: prohibitin family protein [Candidatus Niyogibacteria bacterium]|nr:prohibitin family protein [Candidatus Niyogibacteria bacterium]